MWGRLNDLMGKREIGPRLDGPMEEVGPLVT